MKDDSKHIIIAHKIAYLFEAEETARNSVGKRKKKENI
jgi:hypothetical protein